MKALYQVKYTGVSGIGFAAFYIGGGQVVGVDPTGAQYHGSYVTEESHFHGNKIVGRFTLTASGGILVTGQPVEHGTEVLGEFSLPENFADGSPHTITVGGAPVTVMFEKIGEII